MIKYLESRFADGGGFPPPRRFAGPPPLTPMGSSEFLLKLRGLPFNTKWAPPENMLAFGCLLHILGMLWSSCGCPSWVAYRVSMPCLRTAWRVFQGEGSGRLLRAGGRVPNRHQACFACFVLLVRWCLQVLTSVSFAAYA